MFSRCRIARYRRLLVDQIVVLRDAEGRAFCRSDFAHQILRIQRNHGADAALAPAGFLCSVFTAGGSNLPPHRCDLLDACGLPLLVGRIVTIGRRHHPVAKILCARHPDARLTRALRVLAEQRHTHAPRPPEARLGQVVESGRSRSRPTVLSAFTGVQSSGRHSLA